MSARRVRKKRTMLLNRRRLNALPAGGKLIPAAEPGRESAPTPEPALATTAAGS